MTLASDHAPGRLVRWFTPSGVSPYDSVSWHRRDARLTDHRDGSVAFEQLGVEFPEDWSVTASNIVAQKYFRGSDSTGGPRVVAASGDRPGRRGDRLVG